MRKTAREVGLAEPGRIQGGKQDCGRLDGTWNGVSGRRNQQHMLLYSVLVSVAQKNPLKRQKAELKQLWNHCLRVYVKKQVRWKELCKKNYLGINGCTKSSHNLTKFCLCLIKHVNSFADT